MGLRLAGPLPVAAVAGVAEFHGLEIDKQASGYTFQATRAAGLTAGDILSF